MTIGIFGAGNIGGNLARLLARTGELVLVAGSGDVARTAERLGNSPGVTAATPDAVAGADIVVLALPWSRLSDIWPLAAQLAGKIVLDVTNPYNASATGVEDLRGGRSSAVVQRNLPGARVVKAINTLRARYLLDGARPAGAPDRSALPVSGDDPTTKAEIAALLDRAGFSTRDAGTIAESGAQEPGGSLYDGAMSEVELERAIARARLAAA